MLGPSLMHIKFRHMYTTDFAYDVPIFLVPLSLSYPTSPVVFKSSLAFDNTSQAKFREIKANSLFKRET